MTKEQQDLLQAIEESLGNPELTAVDHAANQEKLRDVLGWSGNQIAELFACSPAWVSELRAISRLHPEVQDAIRNNGLSVPEAYRLKNLTMEEQELFIRELKKRKDNFTNKEARKLRRERDSASRSVSEIREFLAKLLAAKQPQALHDFARNWLAFIRGELQDDEMEVKLRDILSDRKRM